MKNIKKQTGEGGVHSHELDGLERTKNDGAHKHLFYANDRLMMTEMDGEHFHEISLQANYVDCEGEHAHTLNIKTTGGVQTFLTEESEYHNHELQSKETTLSGLHVHFLKLGEYVYPSLLPSDIVEDIEASVKQEKRYAHVKFEKSCNLEDDYNLIKKLNEPQYKSHVSKAVERNIIKALSSLKDGLKIESLILSRERFGDIGLATSFVLNNGLNFVQSNVLEREGVYTFQVLDRNKFSETTLQRIRITEGVDAIVGFITSQEETIVVDTEMSEQVITNSEPETTLEDKGPLYSKIQSLKSMYCDESKECKKSVSEKHMVTFFEIVKQDNDERLVFGPVLIPENVDLQEDIISPEEIKYAAHNYMIKLAFMNDVEFLEELGLSKRSERGFMHNEFNRKIAVVETFLAPAELRMKNMKGEEKVFPKGTWLMTMKVFDDEAWSLVKSGRIKGFSIGGRSMVREEEI
jgi:hypothetical protein